MFTCERRGLRTSLIAINAARVRDSGRRVKTRSRGRGLIVIDTRVGGCMSGLLMVIGVDGSSLAGMLIFVLYVSD